MTKIAKTTKTVTFLMVVVGLARPVAIEPDGTKVEAQGTLVCRLWG